MKVLQFSILFFLTNVTCYGQHTITIQDLFKKTDKYCHVDFIETEKYIDSLIYLATEQKDTIAYIKGLMKKGICSIHHNPNKESIDALLEAKKWGLYLNAGIRRDTLIMEIDNEIGGYYYRIEELDSAFHLFERMISEFRRKTKLSSKEYEYLGISYLYAGAIKKKQKSYNEAIDYYTYVISNEKEMARKENRPPSFASTLGRLGIIYNLKGDYRLAVASFKKAIDKFELIITKKPEKKHAYGSYLVTYQQGISESYIQLNKPDSAIYYLKETFNYPVPNLSYRSKSNILLGQAYDLKKDAANAVHYYDTAIENIEQQYGNQKHISVAETFTSVGDYYIKNRHFQKALNHYQKAISNLVADFDNQEISANPSLEKVLDKGNLLEVLDKKVKAFHAYWKSSGDLDKAAAAWETGKIAINLLEQVKQENFVFEQDLIETIDRHYGLYEMVLEVGYVLGPTYRKDLFLIIEKSKTASLLKNISINKASLYANIPSELIQEERLLNRKISQLNEKVYQARPNTAQDTMEYLDLKNRLFETEEQRNKIRATYQKEQAYQAFAPTYLGIAAVQEQLLSQDKGIIEYFVGTENTYAFLIQKDTFYLHKLTFNEQLLQAATTLKEDVFHKRDSQYIEKASALYQAIFAPIEAYGLPSNLVIMPDGILHYVPFDILLKKPPSTNEKYATYSFLIKKYTFSYCHSSTLLYALQHKAHTSTPKQQVLSFAPSFYRSEKNYNQLMANRSQLNELTYTLTETEKVSGLMNSKLVTGKAASKSLFLDLAANYQYLHLATHGKVNDNNAKFSFIAFSNMVDTLKESYKLFTNELNDLTLNADMVVLSACETGVGQAYKGEGLISLSRGFLAAGAKSIVTTLWSINDKFTSEIVTSFYENLKKSMGKEEALRQAKLTFLQTSDNFEAHPKYWAAFVPVGDMSPLDEQVFTNGSDSKLYLLFTLFISVLFVFFLVRLYLRSLK